MTHRILIFGDGILADLVHEWLCSKDDYTVVHSRSEFCEPTKDVDLGLVLNDGWSPRAHSQAEALFRRTGTPWLRGFVALGTGIVGPFVQPDKPLCSECADERWINAQSDKQELWQLRSQLTAKQGSTRDSWASRTSLVHMRNLIVAHVEQALRNGSCTLVHHVLLSNLRTLATTRHFVLPNSACKVCAGLPLDTWEDAVIQLTQSPKTSPLSYRTRSIHDIAKTLRNDYLDSDTGLINAKVLDLITPFAGVSVNLPLPFGNEGTAGRSNVYSECEPIAILEGLERYCGLQPRRTRPVVRDSYSRLSTKALNPPSVGLHHPLEYHRADFPFQAFQTDAPMDWVWGYSLTEERPILVPLRLAYYSLGFHENAFVYETSNGCAVGSTLTEAIFHGILEVVERDAFLLTWYAKLPLPELDLSSHPDRELMWMVQRVQAVTGYALRFYNATVENGIPTVLVLAKNTKSRGLNLLCAAGSHPDPLHAIKSAIHENAGMLLRFDEKLDADKSRYLEMLLQPNLVREMGDHSMLYGLPEAESRLDFLLDPKRPIETLDQAFPPRKKSLDLAEDLAQLLTAFRRQNQNVIVVNQTAPELARNGLFCVKVIIPGMLPMTFGHRFTRLEHLNRALLVPMQLGYTKKPLSKAELNPHPHPFP